MEDGIAVEIFLIFSLYFIFNNKPNLIREKTKPAPGTG